MPSGRTRTAAAAAGTFWLLLISFVVFWPTPVDAGVAGLLQRVLDALHLAGPTEWVDYALIEAAANVVLFLPLGGCLLVLLPPGRRWISPFACLLVSLGIEVGQLVLLPQRFATGGDVAANTAGAVVGAATAWWWLRWRNRRAGR